MYLKEINYTYYEFWESQTDNNIVYHIWSLEKYDKKLSKIINWKKTIEENLHQITGVHLELNTEDQVIYNTGKYRHDLLHLLRSISKNHRINEEEIEEIKCI